MKRAELTELGLEKDVIDKIMAINGADIENAKKDSDELKTKLAEKEQDIADLNEKVKNIDSDSETIKSLKEQVEKYQTEEAERKENEKRAQAEKVLNDSISAWVGEREFTSDFAKNGFISAVKAKRAEDSVSGLNEICDALAKDTDGIFKNKQQEHIEIPGVKHGVPSSVKAQMDAKYKDNPFYKE